MPTDDGSFPTYVLTHWGRDRARGRFDIPFLVKRQTQDTARAVGLHDRGALAPELKADLNVIDMNGLAIPAPRMADDLPAGGRRLLQDVDGYRVTIKAGETTFVDGDATGALPGRTLRATDGGVTRA